MANKIIFNSDLQVNGNTQGYDTQATGIASTADGRKTYSGTVKGWNVSYANNDIEEYFRVNSITDISKIAVGDRFVVELSS
jgi:hypothetical protein